MSIIQFVQMNLAEKRSYLAENIEQAEEQNDFFDFWLQKMGSDTALNQYFENEPFQAIKNMVIEFKLARAKEQAEEIMNRTYADMQTSKPEDIQAIRQEAMKHQAQISMKKQPKITLNLEEQKNNEKVSALELLDSVFDNSESQFDSPPQPKKKQSPEKSKISLDLSAVTFDHKFYTQNFAASDLGKKQTKKQVDFNIFNTMDHINMLGKTTDTTPTNIKKHQQLKAFGLSSEVIAGKKKAEDQKKQSPYAKKKTNQVYQGKEITEEQAVSMSPVAVKKIPYKGVRVHKEQLYTQIKCREAGTRGGLLSAPNLSIIIEKHDIIERSFFSSNYVMYHIRVKPANIIVKRNYQDFQKLKNALANYYPGMQLPYLDKNNWFETSLQNVKKQKNMLQFFLNDLINNKQIRNSIILEAFLTLPDHKAIKRKFQTIATAPKPFGIQQLALKSGKVAVAIGQKQRIFQQFFKPYLRNTESLMEKYLTLCQNLSSLYSEVEATLGQLSTIAIRISKETQQFNSKVEVNQIKNLTSVFNYVRTAFDQQKSDAKFELQILNRKIIPFIKYQSANVGTIRSILEKQQSFYRSYMKRKQMQDTGDQTLYTSDKLRFYKDGVTVQSKNFQVLTFQCGYFNRQLCDQAQRSFELMAENFKKKYHYFSNKYVQQSNKNLQYWSKLNQVTT